MKCTISASRSIATLALLVVSIFMVFDSGKIFAAEHNHGPTGTYTDWNWPEAPLNPDGKRGYLGFEHCVTPEVEPARDVGYFWSHQVAFIDGEAAYFGLQTLGRHPDGQEGKVAIFSVWNALSARGPGIAKRFDGEGEGFQTMIPFEWKARHKYQLRMFRSGSNPKGTEWTATVQEEGSGQERVIGRITVPKKWGYLSNWSVMWSERYTGPEIETCDDVGYSKVLFGQPAANGGQVRPAGHSNHLSDPANCPNSRLKDQGSSVCQEMGIMQR